MLKPFSFDLPGDNIYPDGAAFNPYTITRWWGDVKTSAANQWPAVWTMEANLQKLLSLA